MSDATTNTTAGTIRVQSPSRLHFGLLSFGGESERQFGGVGMMIDQPAVRISLTAAERFTSAGPLARRVAAFARCWSEFHGFDEIPACRITVESAPPEHVGLGVGTQLALSVAAALNAFHRWPCPPPAELARSVGRGSRSAVGTYGFYEGGLIVERGKRADESLSPLDSRLDVPGAWRVALVRPRDFQGLAGSAEQAAFAQMPAVPREVSESLRSELSEHLLPALVQEQFASFSESLYRYGRAAGLCFKAVQGGPYNGPQLSQLVDQIRSLGIAGVGQSSWGPTLFALLADDDHAAWFQRELPRRLADAAAVEVMITAPNNRGASL